MSKSSSYWLTGMVILLIVFMLVNPRETVAAASFGFHLWYTTVFPALFPFFIAAELLVGVGFVKILGVWFEPIMRPIFNLPGCSSLVLVMGFTSGFPVGAILTRKLFERRMLTAGEAERLVSFTNNCSPLFIIGAVGVGMFGNPAVGYLLALAHYGSNLLVGFLWRFKSTLLPIRKIQLTEFAEPAQVSPAAGEETENIGALIGKSISNSLNNIFTVGGFIVVFSVLTRMLSYWGIIDIMAAALTKLLASANLAYPLAYGFSMGFFEITLGAKTAASSAEEALPTLLVVSAILAFSGLSIIAQVMSIVSIIPVRLSFYIKARLTQMVLSLAIVSLTYRFFPGAAVSAMSPSVPYYKLLYSFNAWTFSLYCMLAGFIFILIMLGMTGLKKSSRLRNPF